MNKFFLSQLLILIMLLSACDTEPTLDTSNMKLFHKGDIITMRGEGPEYVEALLIRSDTIAFAGSLKDALEIAGESAERIDLNGQTMLPGFIDGHAHFANFAIQAIGANILPSPDGGANNISELIEILRVWNTAENRKLTGWIFGMGFDDSVLEEKRFPTREDLDQVSMDFPVIVIHISGHFAAVNSKGLEILGINADTPDPEGGLIRKNQDGEPNGVLEELAAIPRMLKAVAPKSPEGAQKFFDAGQKMALSYGYTTAQEGRAMENHEILANAAESEHLLLDVVTYIDYTKTDKYMNSKWNSKNYTNHYRIGGVKLTLDGSPQGRTAWRTRPYLKVPEGADASYSGYPAIPNDSMVLNIYRSAFQNKWQILTHANGDAAMDQMIRTMRTCAEEYGTEGRRDVLIHGQYVRFDQLDAFKELNVIASLFPLHTFYWGDWHRELIGDSLVEYISPTRTALDKGLKITIHTDAPVALPNIMRMVGIAVERKSRSGVIVGESERLSPYEALQAVTIWSAYQHFEEERKGSLEIGKLADLVVLDQNPLKVSEEDIKKIQVLETYKEGERVFMR